LTGRERFREAVAGEGVAFAPILWERLPELVRQPRDWWWRDPTLGRRLLADAAALALADAMFVCVGADEVLGSGVPLVGAAVEADPFAVIGALPAPAELMRSLGMMEIEDAEDEFSDLAVAYLQAGADAVAAVGGDREEVGEGMVRAARGGGLFGRPALGLCGEQGWIHGGGELAVVPVEGEWPAGPGVVITPGDVSGRWSADQLRAAGSARR
jgi:hypothetical protein